MPFQGVLNRAGHLPANWKSFKHTVSTGKKKKKRTKRKPFGKEKFVLLLLAEGK